jgi:hypothetical protein
MGACAAILFFSIRLQIDGVNLHGYSVAGFNGTHNHQQRAPNQQPENSFIVPSHIFSV